tara:strand:- start:15 stop:797 length:783 start_codon:yes stop_codon:yes gene_type:complete
MKLLKTNFYSENEVPFLLLNLIECYEHVDKFIAYEFNYTKSGLRKEFVDLKKWWDLFEPYEDKFEYHQIDLDGDDVFVKDENGVGEDIQKVINEPYSRNYFTKLTSLNDDDFVFSVDADEIVYGQHYEKICELIEDNDTPVKLNMHFFWKTVINLTNKPWNSPCACQFKHLKNKTQKCTMGETKYPQWRDEGKDLPFYYGISCGGHFSNCYRNEEEFEYRKKAIYYKPTTYSGRTVALDNDCMPSSMIELKSVLQDFNLL